MANSYLVLRGSSWYFYSGFCRSAFRCRNYPVFRDYGYGFRAVRALRTLTKKG